MCKKFKFDHTNKWYLDNPVSVLENAAHKLQWDFYIQTDHLISASRPGLIIINKKIVEFVLPADHRIKLKESDLAWELKNLWNMKVTIIPIVIGTDTKGLLKGLADLKIKGQVKNIQTATLLITTRILSRVQETWGDLLSLKLQWKNIS